MEWCWDFVVLINFEAGSEAGRNAFQPDVLESERLRKSLHITYISSSKDFLLIESNEANSHKKCRGSTWKSLQNVQPSVIICPLGILHNRSQLLGSREIQSLEEEILDLWHVKMGVLCHSFEYLHIENFSCAGTLNIAWWVDEDMQWHNTGICMLETYHR